MSAIKLKTAGCKYKKQRKTNITGFNKRIVLTTPGKICLRASAAAVALLAPDFASSKVKRVCRTGFEYDTVELSTKVIFWNPHA